MVRDYQSKVALAFAFNDAIERLEESMTPQRSRESPTRPVQDEATKNKKRTKKAKTSLPTAAPQGHLDELTEVPTTKDPELQTTTQRLADEITSTPTKRPRTIDSGEESFRTIQRKKKKQGSSPPQARKPSPYPTRETTPDQPAERRTRPARIPPLVIEGPLIDKITSPTELRKVIKIPDRIRVTRTKAGTYLFHCRTDDDRLKAITHGSKHTSVCMRPTKRTTEQHLSTALQVVVVNFPTHIKVEDIRRKGNERFHRMRSPRNNRDINKMKITTNNEAERDHLLENHLLSERPHRD